MNRLPFTALPLLATVAFAQGGQEIVLQVSVTSVSERSVFLDRGRIVFSRSLDDVESQFREVAVHPDRIAAARALRPIHERPGVGRSILLFEGVDPRRLAALGDVRTPSVADLFVAVVGGPGGGG